MQLTMTLSLAVADRSAETAALKVLPSSAAAGAVSLPAASLAQGCFSGSAACRGSLKRGLAGIVAEHQ